MLYILSLLLITLIPVCYPVCTDSTGCYPPIQNIAPGHTSLSVSASSTCGQETPELSCPLTTLLGDTTQCYNCTATEHSALLSVDGDSGTWWQASNDVTDVTLQLDFSAPFLLAESSLLWHRPRARSMLLEYSTDSAVSWSVYQYFSPSCQFDFTVPPALNPSDLSHGTTPVCDSTQSNINPHSGGVVSFSPASRIQGGVTNFSSTALDYFLVTNLRARMLSFNRVVGLVDEGYSHAVSEWRVFGSCFCNAHAESCDVTACVCAHNTEGDNCERCQPLYNNREYQAGSLTAANSCEQCQCNSHATVCVYNSSVESGVCLDCQDNTTGDKCDSCLPFFYRDPLLLLTDPAICRPCGCVAEGTADAGMCQVSTGDCTCKRNVFGRQCDQCQLGFYNLSSQPDGCQACNCHETGSLLITCDTYTGQCSCKENVEGTQCDTCQDGYYGLSPGGSLECVACGCDLGSADSPVCDKQTGECSCLPNFTGTKCDAVESGYFLPAPDYLLFEGEGDGLNQTDVPGYEGLNVQLLYTGEGLVVVERGDSLDLIISVPLLLDYIPVLRYFSLQSGSVFLEITLIDNLERCGLNNRVQSAVLNTSEYHFAFQPTCLQESPSLYTLSITPTDATLWVDSVVLIPSHALSPIFSQLSPQQQQEAEECTQNYYSLTPAPTSCAITLFSLLASFYRTALSCSCNSHFSTDEICAEFGGQCPCRDSVTNRDCSRCIPGYHSISTLGCTPCNCDVTGARLLPCDLHTGECVCKTGVTGVSCNTCQAGHYGIQDTGCQECACSKFSSDIQCDDTGQCSCLMGVTGEKCSSCRGGYFQLTETGCLACECSEETSESADCSDTGVCSCVNGFSGDKCGQCGEGSYVTPGPTGPVCEGCKCFNQTNLCSNQTLGYTQSQLISNFSSCESYLDTPNLGCTMGWRVDQGFYLQLAVNEYITFIVSSPSQVYWYAPYDPFLGNRSLSYGYNLVLSVFSEDLEDEDRFEGPHPDVILEGSFIPDQLVSSFPSEVTSSPGNPFSIPLLESSWRVGDREGPVATYVQLIQVLSNLKSLRIRARYSEASIARSSMEYFIMETLVEDHTADDVVVERCECPPAYTGTSCASCSPGYYRSSLNPVDACIPCQCNSHTELCDPITGLCLSCQHNTTGDACQNCIDGFFGDATTGTPSDCQLCPCPLATQSVSHTCYLAGDGLPFCDACREGYTGRTCERCEDGYYGLPRYPGSQCTTCDCSGNIDLSQTGNCNTTTGECLACVNNTAGYECEVCAPGYYGDALLDQCVACQCNKLGREDNECNSTSGVCTCKPHVVGDLCDRCEGGYWGLHLNLSDGCISCDCCSNGSLSHTCNTSTGVCSCKENIGGVRDIKCCDCSSNAFNFTDRGCELCGCDVGGSVSESCHQQTGLCQCRVGVEGDKCEDCTFGYTGTPPGCDKCPQCFDDWLVILQTENATVTELYTRVDLLLYSFLPLNISDIISQISYLNTQLQMVIIIANSSELNNTELYRVELLLALLSLNITDVNERLDTVVITLNRTQDNIDYACRFNGSVELETGEVIDSTQLMDQLVALMGSVEDTRRIASDTQREIATVSSSIRSLQASIDSSRIRVNTYTNTSMRIRTQLEAVSSKIFNFTQKYEANRVILSGVEQREMDISDKLNASSSRVRNATYLAVRTYNVTEEASLLAIEKLQRADESELSLQTLSNTSNSTLNLSDAVLTDAIAVLDTSTRTADLASDTQVSQQGNITTLQALQGSGESTRDIQTATLAITGQDPSIAEQLSGEINEQAVPADVVDRISKEANRSMQQAMLAQDVANQAKLAANNASNLLFSIERNIDMTQATQSMTTNVTIENAKNALQSAREAVKQFYTETEELSDTSEQIISLRRNVRRVNRGLGDKFEEGAASAYTAVDACGYACELATSLNNTVDGTADQTQNLSGFLSQKEAFVADNFSRLHSLVNATQSLLDKVTSVKLSELGELMNNLAKEEILIQELKEETIVVEKEISEVEESISNLAELYTSCPAC